MKSVKFDKGKPKVFLVPPKAIIGTARAMTHGAKKYEFHNYKKGTGLDWDRPASALFRHLLAWIDGEDYDSDSGLHHLDHAGACIAILQDLVYSNIGKDTRFRYRK